MIPKDPVMLLSYLNTQLRDYYSSLEELCQEMNLNQNQIMAKMEEIGYTYSKENNQFC